VEFRQLDTFVTVARELSFSRAAAGLGYVQSSVSSQVAALEREFGVPLFDRLGRRIALTEAGKVMLDYSERLLDLAREAGVRSLVL
jgi:DNA-binding transcriptional LysR family regulator